MFTSVLHLTGSCMYEKELIKAIEYYQVFLHESNCFWRYNNKSYKQATVRVLKNYVWKLSL